MSIYAWEDLLSRWHKGELTTEQAIGQLFLRLQNAEGAAHGNSRDLDQLSQEVATLTQRLNALEQRLA